MKYTRNSIRGAKAPTSRSQPSSRDGQTFSPCSGVVVLFSRPKPPKHLGEELFPPLPTNAWWLSHQLSIKSSGLPCSLPSTNSVPSSLRLLQPHSFPVPSHKLPTTKHSPATAAAAPHSLSNSASLPSFCFSSPTIAAPIAALGSPSALV